MEEKSKLKMMLETLPDKIMLKEIDLLQKTMELDKLGSEIKATENSYMIQIANETQQIETKVQKVYKNELERKQELDIRLANNPVYISNLDLINHLKKEIKDEEIKLSYLKRRFRAAESISRVGE